MRELPKPREAYIHLGGDFTRKGAVGYAGCARACCNPLEACGRPNRLDLARWLVDPANPLTARVTVNRIWQQYFGEGSSTRRTISARRAHKPTHPELLDWLATEFMDRGWSQKAMHRLIVTSATYRQSSQARPDAAARSIPRISSSRGRPACGWMPRSSRCRAGGERLADALRSAAPACIRRIPAGAITSRR